jgi:hypothetical protein
MLSTAGGTTRAQSVWLTPSPGSLDYLDLASPEGLAAIAQDVRVLQFYVQHLLMYRFEDVGPNTYRAFVARDTFRNLRRFGLQMGMEAGVVKSYWCSDVGARSAIALSSEAIRNVLQAHGMVNYISIDEPFIGGMHHCGMFDWQVAERVASYTREIRRMFPTVRIGLTEAYPSFDWEQHGAFERLLRERQAALDFYHLDLHLSMALKKKSAAAVEQDVRLLAEYLERKGVPFGLIIWGEDGRSDSLYVQEAMKLVRLTRDIAVKLRRLPRHLPLQSWTATPEGLVIVPRNLPPGDDATHLNLVRRARTCIALGRECQEAGAP